MTTEPAAFDAFAADYDDAFTGTLLGTWLRQRVWQVLGAHFPAGQHILELTCGTGTDAVWLAGRGVRVTATDGAAAMVATARRKVAAAGLEDWVSLRQLSWQTLCAAPAAFARPGSFDGAFSNFGGLNTVDQWPAIAAALGQLIRPGGKLILVPMGPFCPWETGWHLLHGQLRPAIRRWRGPATATIGQATIPIWYPSARRLRRDFAPWFRPLAVRSLGLWLPPSYLGHLVDTRPGLFRHLQRLETATARFTGGWGDHYIQVLQRHTQPPAPQK